MKKKITIPLLLTILIAFSCLFEFVYHTKEFGEYSEEKNYVSFYSLDNAIELVEGSEEILICKVVNQTITTNRLKDDMPLTHYKIKVISYLKGNGSKFKSIKLLGGTRINNTYVYYDGMVNSLIKGNYYLMFNNIKVNEKQITEDNVLIKNYQVVSLDGYNENKDINNQNNHIQYTINKYQNIINKKVYGNDNIVGPTYNSLKEKYDAYDNVFVGYITSNVFEVNDKLSINDMSYLNNSYGVNGIGSDAFTLSYQLTIDEVYKGTLTNNTLYQVGADVYKSGNGLQIIESGRYIIFANKELNSGIESASIPENSLVITNSSQLIKATDEVLIELENIKIAIG